MEIRVLGCSGGIGHPAATTSFLIDRDVLIDAGSGVMDLDLAEMAQIDHVFLTHAHLDHVVSLPLMADSVGASRNKPLAVYARPETIDVLRTHLFNNSLWPDFTVIPTPEQPFITLNELPVGGELEVGGRRMRSVAVNHTVPAVAWFVSSASGTWAFSGDTAATDEFWAMANGTDDLRSLVIETTFPDEQEELAQIAKHLCPRALAGELAKLQSDAQVFLTHLMPGMEEEIMAQVRTHLPDRELRPLAREQRINI
jgi:ribonuclease BN (tRNA processing enzyme)